MLDVKIVDMQKKYMNQVVVLLQEISVYYPDSKDYETIWSDFARQENTFGVVALINEEVVGYGAVIIETKIRGGKLGHIEDIVSKPNMQKKGIGKLIMQSLYEISRERECYKLSLHCRNENVGFYKKCGYDDKAAGMHLSLIHI